MSLQDIFNYIKTFLIEKYDAISNFISKVLHWIWTVDLLDVFSFKTKLVVTSEAFALSAKLVLTSAMFALKASAVIVA